MLAVMLRLTGHHEYSQEIKKSRFIAHAVPVESPEEALAALGRLGNPRATHNCWAYRIGDLFRFSDDGEPAGTAGRPILSAIDGRSVDCVMVIVTRFYGGIKLGAGGLVRAYGGSASRCLGDAPVVEVRLRVAFKVRVSFDHLGAVHGVVTRKGVTRLGESYDDEGVTLALEVDEDGWESLTLAIRDASRGQASIQR